MRNRPGLFAVLLATLLTTSFVGLVEAADQNLPVPTVVVPTLSQPPVIDGTLEAGEWHDAAAVTGFVTAFKNQLSPYQSVARVARHEGYIYVALVNQRSRFDTLLKKTARQPDDTRIVSDHANEIWMTPPLEPPTTYQTLFNAYPAVFDARIMPTVGNTSKSWSADWEIAGSEDREHWYIEARAPLDSFGGAEVSDDTIWRGLFTTDVIGRRTGGFRAWAPGGAFADIDRHGFLHFKDGAPAAQWLDATRLRTDDYRLPFAFTGGEENAVIDLVVRIGGNVEATPQDHIVKRSLTVGPGERKQVVIEGSFDDIDLPTGRFPLVLDPSQRETFRHGFAEITATRRDGLVLYQQLVPFVIDNFVVEGPEEIVRNPYDASIGVNATLAPLSRQLLVQVDRLYMDEPTRVAGGTAALTDAETGEVLATRKIAPFRHDDSDFAIDLADVEMPVETEADWLQQQAAKKAGEQAPGVKPRPLRLKVDLVNAEGAPLATAEQAVEAMTYEFEWLGNRIGMSDEVIPPWEPVVVDGKTVSMWNKTYDVNALGLADRIVNSEAPQLSGPMRLEAVIDGETLHIEPGDLEAGKSVPVRAEWRGETRTDRLAIDVDSAVEFDGAVFNTMRIQPAQNVSLKRLSLVVEMPEREGELMVTTSGGWNAFHGWTPRKWDSRQTSSGSVAGSFVPYVLLTDSERGFQVFADNDKGWRVDPDLPTHEVVRENGKTKLRVNFVHRAKEGLSEPTTVEYGWITTPQKPQPANWRGYELWTYSTYPEATAMFWTDADWALVYPYFTSPFPWDYEKSKELLQQRKDRGTIPAVGNIAHAIGRYQDYKGRTFLPVAGDWAPVPGQRTGRGDVARSRGATDFQVWHYDKWIRDSDLVALYFDEPYLHEDRNFLTGGAYLTEDERIQPGYSYLDLREYFLRLRYLFHSHGLDRPNLWIHTTAGQPVYSWFPDLSMAGENVAPMGGKQRLSRGSARGSAPLGEHGP